MNFTIKELEALSGIKAHTIRIWEQRYHFLRPARTQTNIRRYSNEELKTLLTVALLNKYGHKISRIDVMTKEERVNAALTLTVHEAYNERLVNKLIAHMIDMKNVEFEKMLNDHIKEHGIEKTVRQIIFFFLERVGILWHTNHILPAQEHIVSNIVRQKILSAINELPLVHKHEPMVLLFLPEGEHHEMGLLIVHYLLRRKKIPVIYLGANVPLSDIHFLSRIKAPDYFYLHLSALPRKGDLQKEITALSRAFPRIKILLSGSAIESSQKPLPSNVIRLKSFDEVTAWIESLK